MGLLIWGNKYVGFVGVWLSCCGVNSGLFEAKVEEGSRLGRHRHTPI